MNRTRIGIAAVLLLALVGFIGFTVGAIVGLFTSAHATNIVGAFASCPLGSYLKGDATCSIPTPTDIATSIWVQRRVRYRTRETHSKGGRYMPESNAMKYLLLLLAVVSLPACGQTGIGHPSFGAANNFGSPEYKLGGKCNPKDKDNQSFSSQGEPFVCDPKSGKFVDDKITAAKWKALFDAEKIQDDAINKHRDDLALAIISRVITDAEMLEVATLGTGIFEHEFPYTPGTNWSVSYGPTVADVEATKTEKMRRFNDLMLQQFKLRAIAAEHRPTWQEACAKARAEDPGIIGCSPTLRANDPPLGLLPKPSGHFYNQWGDGCGVNGDGDFIRGDFKCAQPAPPQFGPWQTEESAPYAGYYCGSHDCTVKSKSQIRDMVASGLEAPKP